MIVFYKADTYNIFHPILFNAGCSHVVVHNIKLLCTFLRTATRAAPCSRVIPKRYYRTHVDEGMDNMTQMDYITAQDNATMRALSFKSKLYFMGIT